MRFHTIVIGLGAMGGAALYHLARRGVRVLGIEQFGVGHDRGSSHGQTRIIRKSYFEHPDYVPLVERSCVLWRELERNAGRELFVQCGLLVAGAPDGVVVSGIRRAAQAHNLSIESLSREQAERRFPGFKLAPPLEALFEKEAGFLRVEDCVRAHVEAALSAGAEVRSGQRVLGWRAESQQVRVETDHGAYSCEQLVICGGPWAGRLLSDLGLPLTVRRKVQLWFPTLDNRYSIARGCPTFCFDVADGFFYGPPEIVPGEIKVAQHFGGEPVPDPSQLDRELHDRDSSPVIEFLSRHLPGVRPTVLRHSVCMYTMSPDEHFIIDHHPRHSNVHFAAGFSGHGFKFAPVVGSVMADFALNGYTVEGVGFLSLKRLSLAGRTS